MSILSFLTNLLVFILFTILPLLFVSLLCLAFVVWVYYGRSTDVPIALVFVCFRVFAKKARAENHEKNVYEFLPNGRMWQPSGLRIVSKVGEKLIEWGVWKDIDMSIESIERIALKLHSFSNKNNKTNNASNNSKDEGEDLFMESKYPYRASLCLLLQELKKENRLSLFGKFWYKYDYVGRLSNRLEIRQELKKYPEIVKEEINDPIIIMGAFRTGTTLLQSLLARDPSLRILRAYEGLNPGFYPCEVAQKKSSIAMDVLFWGCPAARAAHHIDINEPEECHLIHRLMFVSLLDTHFFVHVPQFRDAHLAHVITSTTANAASSPSSSLSSSTSACFDKMYEFQKVVLQLHQWRWRNAHALSSSSLPPFSASSLPRWVLKCPDHMLALDSVSKVFPDASFIWTHRDPSEVLPSMTSLAAIFRSFASNKVQEADVAIPMKQLLMTMYERAMLFRTTLESGDSNSSNNNNNTHNNNNNNIDTNHTKPARFVDVHYLKFVQNPLATLASIYSQLGLERNAFVQEQQAHFLSSNPRHKHGIHRYSAKQFGYISEDFREDIFEKYIDQYGVKQEQK